MAPLPAPAEKPSHRVSDSQSHAKVRPPTQVAVFCAALWPNLQPALTVANGELSSTVIEIEVKAHIRRIVRLRYRRGCDCASSPLEVAAPPVPRLFPRTPYGTTVWARILFERFACFRPLRRVAAWLTDQGLAIAPGTVAGSVPRFLPLFEPLAKAILAHQSDRYAAYGKMARELDGKVILCWCWVHQRRDFIECAAGQAKLTQWCEGWIERIASVYRLNEARLEHYDPGLERQTPEFDAAQGELKKAVDGLFAHAERKLAALPAKAREGKALRSLLKHREGLSVFVGKPQVPMDNNAAERGLRGAVIGRRLSFGSDSEKGADFTAIMYSVVAHSRCTASTSCAGWRHG